MQKMLIKQNANCFFFPCLLSNSTDKTEKKNPSKNTDERLVNDSVLSDTIEGGLGDGLQLSC